MKQSMLLQRVTLEWLVRMLWGKATEILESTLAIFVFTVKWPSTQLVKEKLLV